MERGTKAIRLRDEREALCSGELSREVNWRGGNACVAKAERGDGQVVRQGSEWIEAKGEDNKTEVRGDSQRE